ncbi:TIGR02099 family protein [Pseudoluteimonas lycopersici]|uniref:TIGR02099 family protein n=1 Tax=Pseudoluteimonas lycopersici TaxID=1324796 RepID=A0A516V439_9GAMM|nr:YhdP family protein [Lysobacter lycopersici]QDQ73298.1 TIGR02099 family protein [Lysobacter lycopersici]
MTTPLRMRLRHARRWFGYGIAALLVAMALGAGAMSQLLPLAERHPDRIAAWLSARAGRPVAFDKVETEWTRRGPLLRLDRLRVGAGAQALVIGDAEVLVSQYAGLLPGRSFTELRVRGLDLTLERGDDGSWQVRGLPGEKQGGDPFSTFERLGELQLVGAKLHVVAPALGVDAVLPRVDLRLQVRGDRVQAGVRATMRDEASPLLGVLDFRRGNGNGRAYVSAKKADFAAWSPLLRVAGVRLARGQGRAETWLDLRAHRVVAATASVAIDGMRLEGAPLADGTATSVDLGRVEGLARWGSIDGGWRIDAPKLRVGTGANAQSLDGLLLAGGRRIAVRANAVDAGPLLAVAALSDRLAPGLRAWLSTARPQAHLRNVELAGVQGGALRARGRVEGFGFASSDGGPALTGLTGDVDGDANGMVFVPDPAKAVRFDWRKGFGVVHDIRLKGSIVGWREGAGWRFGTGSLAIDGDGYDASVRGDMWFQGDGTRPWIDLAAWIGDTSVSQAHKFWIHHLMSPATVRWLDDALQGGALHEARALVTGDLDDWPFRHHEGRFEARATLSNATIKFQPEWPALQNADMQVAFIDDGMDVQGKGTLGGVGVRELNADIESFGKARLRIDAKGGGDASQLLALLRESPLYKQQKDTFDALSASGLADVGFSLDIPFAEHQPAKIDGTVRLAGVRATDARWKLTFDDMRGSARYDQHGFDAEGLKAKHEGQPGLLSLRAGQGHVRAAGNAFEAELAASMDAEALIDRAPTFAWLKPYFDGRSQWTIGVALPEAQSASAPSSLQLRSNLVGTRMTLPAPLDKSAGDALATRIDAQLPLGEGEVAVAFGNRLALRARSSNVGTGVRVALGASSVADAPPANGLVASGRAPSLDALDWAVLSRAGDGGQGGLPLQRIDVTAAHLQLLGADFRNTRVQASPAAGGATAIQFDGDNLAGTLTIPRDDGATIAGKLQRFWWRGAAAAPSPNSDAASNEDVDPGKVPPLNLAFDDLRIGDAKFGSASVRTQPAPGALKLLQFQSRAAKQQIDASGEWSGRGAAARSRVDMQLASEDFGAFLNGFGFGGQLARGKGQARLQATWPGSPMGLKLAAFDGNLHIDARDGQLTEVEPGAGRVLGLLSIARLPQRLTLDFHDFFSKGFAFNTLKGDIALGNGQARSDNLRIDGPAAEINIRGVADMRSETYDQTVDVFPKAGNLLTAVGAIAGGPVGAAIGAAANMVLKKPLGQLAAKTYHVSGPWKQPKVDVVARSQAQSQPQAQPKD